MSPDEYLKLLENHDWHFQMSDDYKVYSRGRDEEVKIHALKKQFPELKQVYDKFIEERRK